MKILGASTWQTIDRDQVFHHGINWQLRDLVPLPMTSELAQAGWEFYRAITSEAGILVRFAPRNSDSRYYKVAAYDSAVLAQDGPR